MSMSVNLLAAAATAAPAADAAPGWLAAISPVFLLLWAAALCAVTAVIHSVLGEQRLLRPLLGDGSGIMENPLARAVTRFAWHWTSLLWLLVAAVLVLTAYERIAVPMLVVAIGAVHLAAGLADAILTRGRHIGWPLITLIGALALASYYLTGME